ncbi:MAG TPA: choice-of-anchor D domain-containing protein [Candidatus Saccharimonadales bacterium]|nr:choice-of-anchor D domain-containing protein [Candidatus Saccharimonadales bacterium]
MGRLSASALDFGTLAVGQSADRTFTLTNRGGGRLTGTVAVSCSSYAVVGRASFSLGPGESATFTIRCTPATAGSVSCNVSIGAGGCGPVRCVANAVWALPPACRVTPASLDFGAVTVGDSADRTVTITNVGGSTLAGSAALSGTGCDGIRVLGTADYSLGAGQSAAITVRFVPARTGPVSCALDASGGCSEVRLAGQGRPVTVPAYIEIYSDQTFASNFVSNLGLLLWNSLDFGDWGCGHSLCLLPVGIDTTGFLLVGCPSCTGLPVDSTVYEVDVAVRNESCVLRGTAEFHAVAGLCDARLPLRPEISCDSASVALTGPGLGFRTNGQMAVGLGFVDRGTPRGHVAFTTARFTFKGMDIPLGAPVRRGRFPDLGRLP